MWGSLLLAACRDDAHALPDDAGVVPDAPADTAPTLDAAPILDAGASSDAAADSEPVFACGRPGPSFARCDRNPILSGWRDEGGLHEWIVADPSVLFDARDGVWRMWFSTIPVAACDARVVGAHVVIKSAQSADGVTWEVHDGYAFQTAADPSAWDHTHVETPTVIEVPDAPPGRRFALVYAGGNADVSALLGGRVPAWQIGLAFSDDGRSFERLPERDSPYRPSDTPFRHLDGLVLHVRDVFPGAVAVENGAVADPEITVRDGLYHLFFGSLGTTADGATPLTPVAISHAVSTDLVHWTPSLGNPVLTYPGGVALSPTGFYDENAGLFRLWLIGESDAEREVIPSLLFPTLGFWSVESIDGETFGPLPAARDLSWDPTVAAEDYGLVAGPEVVCVVGECRLYYGSFSSRDVPAGSCAILRADGGTFVPGVQHLDLATRTF